MDVNGIKTMRNRMARALGQFRDDREGSVTVEVVVLLPLLFWAFCGLYSFFDVFRQNSISQKAAYTVSDMLSRETTPVTDDYLDSMQQLLGFLTRSTEDRQIRVTVVRWDEDSSEHSVEWSQTRGGVEALDGDTVNGWTDRLPVMVDEERLILVETWVHYTPPFNIGLGDQVLRTFVFTRPRFAPQVLFQASA